MPRLPTWVSNCRHVFKELKKLLAIPRNKKAIEEFEKALEKLINEYNTTIYANRFIVGDAVEILLCTLIRSTGLICNITNQERTDLYVQIPNGKGGQFSVKSNFTGKGDIRLINTMGQSKEAKWEEPTIFIIANQGIFYADHYMNLRTNKTNDAITIKTEEIIGNTPKEFRIEGVKIPIKPKNPQSAVSPAADVVKSILAKINSKVLKKHLKQ